MDDRTRTELEIRASRIEARLPHLPGTDAIRARADLAALRAQLTQAHPQFDTQQQVLFTLQSAGWHLDKAGIATLGDAEFWFDHLDDTPRLEFNGFIAGHLEVTAESDARSILAEVDIELDRWNKRDDDTTGHPVVCATCGHAALDHSLTHCTAGREPGDPHSGCECDRFTRPTCVDPDHGIGDHPCDEVLGAERAAALRSLEFNAGGQP